jgi:hypothetical protein
MLVHAKMLKMYYFALIFCDRLLPVQPSPPTSTPPQQLHRISGHNNKINTNKKIYFPFDMVLQYHAR